MKYLNKQTLLAALLVSLLSTLCLSCHPEAKDSTSTEVTAPADSAHIAGYEPIW